MFYKNILFTCLLVWIFHLINSSIRNSYHDPDEYWQSMEISHAKLFGYGYITWEWECNIRSSLFSWIWVSMYWVIRYFHLDDTAWIMHFSPKLIMSTLATISDISLFLFTKKISDIEVAYYTLITSLFNVFNMVYSTRTLSNSVEMILTTIGIANWPYCNTNVSYKSMIISLSISGLACMIRPTSILIWIVPYIALIWKHKSNKHWILQFTTILFILVSIFLFLQILLDTIFYDGISLNSGLLFTPYQFFKKNIIDGSSQYYGVMPWYWYIAYAIPFLLTTWIPFLIYGLFIDPLPVKNFTRFSITFFCFGILFNSLIAHKEFRFIHPLLPVLIPFIGHGLSRWMNASRFQGSIRILAILLTVNFGIALFLNRYHNCGIIPTMDHIADMVSTNPNSSFVFLMPCHSTPWISYLHNPNVNLSMITCDHTGPYQSETTIFYSDPNKFLESRIRGYDYIVLFECLLQEISDNLKRIQNRPEKILWKQFNSFFHPDDNRKGDILIIDNRK